MTPVAVEFYGGRREANLAEAVDLFDRMVSLGEDERLAKAAA